MASDLNSKNCNDFISLITEATKGTCGKSTKNINYECHRKYTLLCKLKTSVSTEDSCTWVFFTLNPMIRSTKHARQGFQTQQWLYNNNGTS